MKSSFCIVALLLPFTLAVPVDSEATVLTPVGLLPASNVRAVPEGGSINIAGNEVQLLDASKNVVHTAQVNNTNLKEMGPEADAARWVAYATWYNSATGSPISYFNTTWSVPPAPLNYHGQTVFLFNGLLAADSSTLLQPVLQYGPSSAGGGAYWAVSNWCILGNFGFYTSLTTVDVGQVLDAVMELTSTYEGGYYYTSSFANVGAALGVTNSVQLAVALEVLEAYNIDTPNDYPVGSTIFSAINLFTSGGSTPSVSWLISIDEPQDGVSANVLVNGGRNGEIEIRYPAQA